VSPSTLAKFTSATSNLSPGANTTIRITPHADGSLLDGLVPTGDGDTRTLLNIGTGPLILLDENNSASTTGNKFSLPGNRPVTVPARGSVTIRYDNTSGLWRLTGLCLGNPRLVTIVPSTLAATNVNDYEPTDATTAFPGRYAYWWKIAGQVGTVITGIKAAPSGKPAYQDGDSISLTNIGSGLTIKHASASSASGNRIFCPGGSDVVLANNGTAELMYYGGGGNWLLSMKAN
jgi:hypothetical protein